MDSDNSDEQNSDSNFAKPDGATYETGEENPAVDAKNNLTGEPDVTTTTPRTLDDLETADIVEFLSRKGTIEVLVELSDGPKRFKEINDAVIASQGTVSKRLTEGARLKLWAEYFSYPDEGGKLKLYQLTPAGETLADLAIANNLDKTTKTRQRAEVEHDTAVSEFHIDVEERL